MDYKVFVALQVWAIDRDSLSLSPETAWKRFQEEAQAQEDWLNFPDFEEAPSSMPVYEFAKLLLREAADAILHNERRYGQLDKVIIKLS